MKHTISKLQNFKTSKFHNFLISKFKHLTIILLIFIAGCNNAQNPQKTDSLQTKKDSIKIDIINKTLDNKPKYTVFKIETSVSDVKKSEKPRSSVFIKNRLKKLIGNSVKAKCDSLGVNYPPQFVLFRTFKKEQEFEIWAGNSRSDSLKLLALLPICAVDYSPAPKLERGDGKTPEGFYNCSLMHGSNLDFMWINLNVDKISEYGEIGNGYSSFKICLDYPLLIDRNRTKKIKGKGVSPGSAICVHGNCVTAGCISFENINFLPVFHTASYHNAARYGKIKIHIYPFRFSGKNIDKEAKKAYSDMKPEQLAEFWKQIEKGYSLFEKTHKALKVTYSGENYIFNTY